MGLCSVDNYYSLAQGGGNDRGGHPREPARPAEPGAGGRAPHQPRQSLYGRRAPACHAQHHPGAVVLDVFFLLGK
jgi:hypothetical protein